MASGIGKKDESAEHDSGIGRIRERTIVIGDTLIAIDNIGSIKILDVSRNWTLARFGVVVAAGGLAAMTMLNNPYSYSGSGGSPNQILGLIVAGFGVAMIIANWLQPLRKGLGIGTGDGRMSYVVSADHAFLNRLLEFLTLKINTRNEGLTASFDITHNTFNTNGGGIAVGAGALASGSDSTIANSEGGGFVIGAGGIASGAGGNALGANGSVTVTNSAPPSLPPSRIAPETPLARLATIDTDEALFADDPQPAQNPPPLKPRIEPPKPARAVPAPHTRPHDALLDGPATGANDEDDVDWLRPPGRVRYGAAPEGGGAGWLLPLVILILAGVGASAGWYFYSQSQTSTSVSLIPTTTNAPLAVAAEPASATATEAEPAATPIEDPTITAAVTSEAAPTLAQAPATATATDIVPQGAETKAFTPPESIVARASGLRYRARPSSADDVPIVAETLAGGEALLVNGLSTQPDGDWYRVDLADGRAAWFKASLTVPRSRFAETFNTSASAQALTLAAASPRILEPAEGVQLSGGTQPVRLAWQGPAGASIFIVEIQAYDATVRRWSENPLYRRVTVNSEEELAEQIPRTGAWRWRVRGVSAEGEQSQFSRWAAFGIRE